MRRKKSSEKSLITACCDDKATIFVFCLNTVAFAVVIAGLVVYFFGYSYQEDTSDEKWIYPLIWCIPSFGWILGIALHLSSSFKFDRLLCFLPLLSIIEILMLLFLAFIFFESDQESSKSIICNQSSSTQDDECVVSKDGHQICGSVAIRELCKQIELGFYLIFMGTVLMAGTQILFVTTGCIRRSRLLEAKQEYEQYYRLRNQEP